MKFFISTLILLVSSNCLNAQVIQSDCSSPVSVIELYKEDAQRITLKRIIDNDFAYADSVIIPDSYSDTILNALIAMHNVVGIPERDTVVDILNIHSREIFSMNNFYLTADSTFGWMQNLSNWNLNTGQPILDNIIDEYDFSLIYYNPHPIYPRATASFISTENFNLKPITDTIETIFGVLWADGNAFGGDGSTIYAEINTTFVELTYRYAWGDCPAGCTGQRLWKFKVYYDCSVEYIGVEGLTLPPTASIYKQQKVPLSLYPNPTSSQLNIEVDENIISTCVLDAMGSVLELNLNSNTIDVSALANGVYILQVETDKGIARKKFIKN